MKSKILLVLGLMLVLVYACNEDDLTQLNPNQVVPENFFQDRGQLESAVFSAYAPWRGGNMTGRFYYFLNDLLGDAHMPTSACFEDAALMNRGGIQATNGMIAGFWQNLYLMIHRANTAIDGITANETVDQAIKTELEAEARFLRGWAYNELATLFGGVPIYTSRVLTPDGAGARATQEATFQQAEDDLNFAAMNLPSSRDADNLGRATAGSAYGILARSHMQQGDLVAARAAINSLKGLGIYALDANFIDPFTEENSASSEIITQVVYAQIGDYNWNAAGDGTNARSVRAQEYNGVSWRNVVPNSKLINAFEYEPAGDPMTDPRRYLTAILDDETYADGTETMLNNQNSDPVDFHGTSTYAAFYKYGVFYKENPGGYRTTNTNFVVQRFADILLLEAEIEAREGNLQPARDLINEIRGRVGMPDIEDSNIPNTTQDEVIQAVIRERYVELASEQVRHRDLVRWGQAGLITPTDERSWFSVGKHEVLPIPLTEIQTNQSITEADQNPGY